MRRRRALPSPVLPAIACARPLLAKPKCVAILSATLAVHAALHGAVLLALGNDGDTPCWGMIRGAHPENVCVFVDASSSADRPHVVPYFLSRLDAVDYPKENLFVYFQQLPHQRVGEYGQQQGIGRGADDAGDLWRKWASAKAGDYGGLSAPSVPHPNNNHSSRSIRDDHCCRFRWYLGVDFFLANPAGLVAFMRDSFRSSVTAAAALTPTQNASTSSCSRCEPSLRASAERQQQLVDFGENFTGCAMSFSNGSSSLVAAAKDCSQFTVPEARRKEKCDKLGISAHASSRENGSLPNGEQQLRYSLLSMLDCMDDDRLLDKSVFDEEDAAFRFETETAAVENNKSTISSITAYVINLERRPARRRKVLRALSLLGIRAEVVPAVDGRLIDDGEAWLSRRGLAVMANYTDPATGRGSMTRGEIGCLLSHRDAWGRLAESGAGHAVVFEDDVRFAPAAGWDVKLAQVVGEAEAHVPGWDFVYLARKNMDADFVPEPAFEGAVHLHTVSYSYWLVAYLLSAAGARKLLRPELLTNMIPVDEFVPLMFDRHPNAEWKTKFPGARDLAAFTVEPTIAEPSSYPGDADYVTDTEDSPPVRDDGGGGGGAADEFHGQIRIRGTSGDWDLSKFRLDKLHGSYGPTKSGHVGCRPAGRRNDEAAAIRTVTIPSLDREDGQRASSDGNSTISYPSNDCVRVCVKESPPFSWGN